MESILTSVKSMLGISEEYEHFDNVLIMHINSVLSILSQVGVGPATGFSITDKFQTWADFIPTDDYRFESVKSYVYMKVKLLFDPPTSSSVLASTERMISELEWRLNVEAETDFIK